MTTTKGIVGFMAANLMANKEPREYFPQKYTSPVILSLETLTRIKSGGMPLEKLADYSGTVLLTIPAALFLVQEMSTEI